MTHKDIWSTGMRSEFLACDTNCRSAIFGAWRSLRPPTLCPQCRYPSGSHYRLAAVIADWAGPGQASRQSASHAPRLRPAPDQHMPPAGRTSSGNPLSFRAGELTVTPSPPSQLSAESTRVWAAAAAAGDSFRAQVRRRPAAHTAPRRLTSQGGGGGGAEVGKILPPARRPADPPSPPKPRDGERLKTDSEPPCELSVEHIAAEQ